MKGLAFVRPITTQETLPGGRIILTQHDREQMSAMQAEIVRVGPPVPCEDEACPVAGKHQHGDSRLQSGAWVLCAKWSQVGITGSDLRIVKQSDIIGVFVH